MASIIPEQQENFDPVALRKRYNEERDKRLREDTNEQYQEVTGKFAHYVDDPNSINPIQRAPLEDQVEVVIIGGGLGGLLAGARLREAGVKDIRIIEKGAEFGGTWYWNRYPGVACDIEACSYLPLLEELNYFPPRKYADGSEVLEHCKKIAHKYDLNDNACMQTEVTQMRWDEATRQWTLFTNRDDRIRARFVIMVNGPLHRPKLPGIEGISNFKGHSFHTSRWDYRYTGGDSKGNLTGLKDKRVGVIGTGATGVQCISHVGESAKQLFVFQRTPSGVDVRNNQPIDQEWANSLQPGWHKKRQKGFTAVLTGSGGPIDDFDDAWVEIGHIFRKRIQQAGAHFNPAEMTKYFELANFEKMENTRNRVDELVNDKAVAETLKPYYAFLCKRPCLDDRYLPTFNRDNVELVDTDGKGVERITEKGVVVNGKEYQLDCLIFATGFEVGTDFTRRAGYDLIGVDGISLDEKWKDGMSSYHGILSRGFPNCFLISTGQAGFTANVPDSLDESASHIAYLIEHFKDNNITRVEASEAAEKAWVEAVLNSTKRKGNNKEPAVIGGRACTPGFYNLEGQRDPRARYNQGYGGLIGAHQYFDQLKAFREEGNLPGLELS
ncbi:MAG: monooxygenase [Gammaproteobacteria bacterium]|nr:MAG: monooxygenase [Gammaproteobacteria bacterium]